MKTTINIYHDTTNQLTSALGTISSQITMSIFDASARMKMRRGYDNTPGYAPPPIEPTPPSQEPAKGSAEERTEVSYDFSIKD